MCARKSKPTRFTALIQQWSSVLASDTEEDNRFKLSMKASIKDSGLLLITNLGTFVCKEYSKITFIYSKITFMPAKNRMIEIVQPAHIPCWCLCQLLVADSEKDLLKIPT